MSTLYLKNLLNSTDLIIPLNSTKIRYPLASIKDLEYPLISTKDLEYPLTSTKDLKHPPTSIKNLEYPLNHRS